MSYQDEIDEVNRKPCKCERCTVCHGTGHDLYDGMDECTECSDGIIEVCDRCRDLEEMTN